jgi:DNA-directed RNA polymerase sigma subunit (sigma70/sigma32)
MVRAIQNFKDIIRMPVHATEALNKILKITCELGMELQREPTLEEVAARAEEDIGKVKKILHQLKVPVVSLEELAYSASSKDSDVTIGDHIMDNCFPSAVTALEAKEDLERASLTIRTLLATIKALPMSDKAKTAFSMYYGLDGHPEGATLESIAQDSGFGVTRERIRQMNAKVWETLAKYGVSMNDEKLVAAIQRVHDLENIVGNEADLSPLTEAMVLNQVSSVFNDAGEDNGELVPADSVTIARRPQANLEKVLPGTLATEDIIRVVGEAYGVTPEIILGDSKPKEVVWVRWVCTYILREKLELSFPKIGQLLRYSEHSVTMYGYRQLVSAMERDPSVKDDIEKIIALCGLKKAEETVQTGPEEAAQVAESANLIASPIVDQVLTLTSQVFDVEKSSLFARSHTRPDEKEKYRIRAKCFAMYALRSDFNVQCQEIAQIFGFGDYSRASVLCNGMAEEVKTDADLQAKLTLLRGQYSLDVYSGDLVKLRQCQKTLFPKQVEEMKDIVEEVVKPFKEKIQRLHAKLDALDVPDRHKEILRLRFGGDPAKETPTYEALGQTYDITRERVRQILVTTMERLTPTLEPSDVDLMVGYTQEFEKVRLVVELQNL